MEQPWSSHEHLPAAASVTRPTIGLMTCRPFTDSRAFHVWSGVCDAARERDLNVVCFPLHTHNPRNQDNILLKMVSQRRVQGIVIYHWWGERADFEANLAPLPPVPVISLTHLLEGHYGVIDDNYGGMRLAVEHLITGHGRRRLAYIHGPEGCRPSEERFRGYVDVLAEHGIPFDEHLITPRIPVLLGTSGAQAVTQFVDERRLRPGQDFDAILTRSDELAISAMDELRRRGIRVPYDVAVIGYDAINECQTTNPPLTSVVLPFYELGQRAVHMLADVIAGKSLPEPHVIVPPRMIVRQSCGCVPASVAQVLTPPERSLPADPAILSTSALPPDTLSQFARDVSAGELPPDRIALFLDTFMAEVRGATSGIFLATFDTLLRDMVERGHDVAVWQTILSTLRRQMLATLNPGGLRRAEDLWHQARMLVQETLFWAHARQRQREAAQAQILRDISQTLITTFDLQGIMAMLVERLPMLGIASALISLYESPEAPETSARLVMAYDAHGRIDFPLDRASFPTPELAPEDVWSHDRRYSLIVEPLYFQRTHIGLAVFETGWGDGNLYEILRGELSSALQGALLVQRVQERSAEIARQKYILESFMANVPDTIYFKDRDSRLTQVNAAFLRKLGINDRAALLGKNDFDFFPENEARPKYEQEQDIIRTGQPLLAIEEPDANGTWSLTTKMPLRDEHGAIIGTFGISRDITELKQAQQAVQQAYSEISILNVQLQEENVRMSAELSVVKQLQQMILPRPQELTQIPGLDIVGYMQPADEVGGDYYDVLHDNGLIHIGIGDVTGHGLESGVLMLMTQAAIRTLIEHGETDPVKFVNTLNRLIYKNAQRIGTDKNLTFALVQYQHGSLKLVGQHEEFLVVRQSGIVERMNTMDLGFPVGLEPEISQWVHAATITLQPGDGIVLYTDGITEAENTEKQQYGIERLCRVISQHWQHSAEAVKKAVVDDVMAHIGTQTVYDDLTLVVLKQQ